MLKSRKGVSVMIGYVLLIVMTIALSLLVYHWLQGLTGGETPQCKEGTSIALSKVDCVKEGDNFVLNLTFVNNGRFNVAGYYIKAIEDPKTDLAVVDIENKINETFSGKYFSGRFVSFSRFGGNSFEAGRGGLGAKHMFNLQKQIYGVMITPVISSGEIGSLPISCTDAIIKEEISCD